MTYEALHLVWLRLPLRRRFAGGAGAVAEREVILVGLERDGATGWGEAAPYPGVTAENAGQTWNALLHRSAPVLAGRPAVLPPTGAAAVEQAAFDVEARLRGVALWERLGGGRREVPRLSPRPATRQSRWERLGGGRREVPSGAAVGLEETPEGTCGRVAEAAAAGAGAVKIKIVPGVDLEHLRAVRERFPDLAMAADGNGRYRPGDPFLEAVDELGLAYIEQPLPADDWEGMGKLRARLKTPLCWDESAHTPAGALRAARLLYADILSLKPGLLGIRGTLRAAQAAEEAGMMIKIGGLVETSVGRAHALALAMRLRATATDLMPARWLLETDVVGEGLRLVDGKMTALPGPGIGMDIHPGRLPGVVRSVRIK